MGRGRGEQRKRRRKNKGKEGSIKKIDNFFSGRFIFVYRKAV